MPIPALSADVLPVGRHVCTGPEIEQRFVKHADFVKSKSRPKIWADWLTGIRLLTSSITVHTAWISGSFVSSKLDPGDIDVTFILSADDVAKRSNPELQIVESFNRRVPHPLTGKPVPAHGLSVDSYTMYWTPQNLLPSGDMNATHRSYAEKRGYWDDWWSRVRVTPKGLAPLRKDALPQRGYLEVNLNGYS